MFNRILKFYIATLICSSITFVEAQQNTNSVPSMNDPKAKEILDKFSENYKNSSRFYAKFTQSIEIPNGKTTTKNGELYLKGNNFKIVFNDQEVYCNEKSVWTYLKDVNEVQINDYEPDPSGMTPNNIFNIYQKDFNYIKIDDEIVSGKNCNVIDLAPKDKSRTYFKVRVWINKLNYQLCKIKIFDKNGYRYTYTVNYLNSKSQFEDTIFIFDKTKYPGVHIEDLRF